MAGSAAARKRLCAIKRLDLALLVHAKHHRHQGRIHVEADDVGHLLVGQVDSLNVSWRCGCKPKARQMRETAVCEGPASLAMLRVLQCVAPRGTLSSVLAITASTRASSMVLGAPKRGASSRPSRRYRTNHARHLLTICGVTRWRAATTLLSSPSAQASTMRARGAKACAVFRRNVRALSSSRSVYQ